MAKKRKREKLGRRIKNWVIDRDYVFLCLFFVAILVGVATCIVVQDKKMLLTTENDLVFSKDNGFYSDNLVVEISSRRNGKIRFNLNGDDINSAGEPYNNAIKLEVPEKGYKVYTLGAALCVDAGQCGNIERRTYVLGKNLDEDVDLDIISITSSQKNLYDYEYGIMVGGKTYDENLGKGLAFVPGNYSQRSEEWTRDANVVVFSDDGDVKMNGDYGLQISGGTSASLDIKSFKVLGNEKYGYDKIVLDLGDGKRVYNSIRLRNGAQDQFSGNVRTSVASRLMDESDFDGGFLCKRAAVFLNGSFYALSDVQQNYSDSFLSFRYNLPHSDLIEKRKGSEQSVLDEMGVAWLFKNDLDDADNRYLLEKEVDIDNYLESFALQILLNNTDWPGSNFEAWRYKGDSTGENYTDGRIRFLTYDLDLTFYTKGNMEFRDGIIGDILDFLMHEKYSGAASFFRNVIQSDCYRSKLISILRKLMNGPFETSHVLQIVDEEAAKINKQMQLFYSDEKYEEWQGWIELLKKAVSERNDVVRADVKKYFGEDL